MNTSEDAAKSPESRRTVARGNAGSLRTGYSRGLYTVYTLIAILLGAFGVYHVLTHPELSRWNLLYGVVYVLGGLLLVVRSSRTGISWDSDTVTVRGLLSHTTLPRTGTKIVVKNGVGTRVPEAVHQGDRTRIPGLRLAPGTTVDDLNELLQQNGLLDFIS